MNICLRILEEKNYLYYLSHVFGWIYFFAWSLCFYGQVIENFRRQSVSGLSFDFEIYNVVGFTTYTIYNVRGYLDDNLGTGPVEIQDIFFAAHALAITLVTVFQIIYYFDPRDKLQYISHVTITILCIIVWGAMLLVFVESGLEYYDPHVKDNRKYIFNSLIYMGWSKVVISFIKYIPPAISNYKRKSTIGWNIHNILLDITGGSLSLLQNLVDSFRDDLKTSSEGQPKGLNIAKFALSVISVFFDVIFITQHYILYKDSNSDLGKNKPKNNIVEHELIESNRESDVI